MAAFLHHTQDAICKQFNANATELSFDNSDMHLFHDTPELLKFQNLEKISAKNCRLMSLDRLPGKKTLLELCVDGNPLYGWDLMGLAGFDRLTSVSLRNCQLEDGRDLRHLISLPALNFLDLTGNPVTTRPNFRTAVTFFMPYVTVVADNLMETETVNDMWGDWYPDSAEEKDKDYLVAKDKIADDITDGSEWHKYDDDRLDEMETNDSVSSVSSGSRTLGSEDTWDLSELLASAEDVDTDSTYVPSDEGSEESTDDDGDSIIVDEEIDVITID